MTQAPVMKVAVVVFDGFTALDAYGPVEAFWACSPGQSVKCFECFTVGTSAGASMSGEGIATVAQYAFTDAPAWDILLVPGGLGTRKLVDDQVFLNQLAAASERSKITATVCTGAALLARTGLLDGRRATSNKLAWDWVIQQGPKVLWQRHARWVDDQSIITSSGVSSGIDMALGLIERLCGKHTATEAARKMEYVWNQDPDDDPFSPAV
ncbi:MAG: DJ-1/PfpI family protein [Planctomycetaceae bacterium]|nr:DJ-1/PfpI family protein [Planctomycetaceae bacterium]